MCCLQIYQRKQVELLSQYQQAQTNLAMQHFTYFQALQTSRQQKQQQQSLQDTKGPEQTSSVSTVDISEDSDTQVSPSTKECAGLRNKR